MGRAPVQGWIGPVRRYTAVHFNSVRATDFVLDASGAWRSVAHQSSASLSVLHVAAGGVASPRLIPKGFLEIRSFVFGTAFESHKRIMLVDTDNVGVFDGPPLVGDDAFFESQGLDRFEDWISLYR